MNRGTNRDYIHYGTTVLCRAAETHGKGQNLLGNAFAVRACTAKTARQRAARQRGLCRAPRASGTAKAFAVQPCFAVRYPYFAVQISLPCV
jgi:hypothetical protein